MTPVCLALPGNETLAAALAGRLALEVVPLTLRHFPDSETYVRIEEDVAGRPAVVVCTLDRPDPKLVPLWLLAATARDLGAVHVDLVAPYLAYLRQDRRFTPGEGLTSTYVGRLLSTAFDRLVTVDPHLHRHASLDAVYSIPATSLPAAPLLAAWIRENVRDPLLMGPDAESAQWVAEVGRHAAAPFIVLEKIRRGDRDVEVSLPDFAPWRGRTPVLVDDIISTGRTMIAAMARLRQLGCPPAVVIGVHAVFADGAYEELHAASPAQVVTTNTIPHPSNAIDVSDLLAGGVRAMLADA